MKGFTLLEILVVVIIFVFIIVGMYDVMIISTTNYRINLVSLNLQRQVRKGMSQMTREIRQARFSNITITGDANNNNIITIDNFNETGVKYYIENTTFANNETLWQLKREYPAGTKITIASDISYLNVTDGVGKIKISTLGASKTFSSGGKKQALTFNLTEQVQPRNP